jgi:putative oxidoreductase
MDTTTSNRRKLRTAYFAAASDSRFPNCRLTRDFCHPDCQDTGSQITGCNFFQENIMDKLLSIAARVLMAQIFVISGFTKITGYSGTQAYMAKMGVPGFLLPLVILTELGGGLALLFGIKTRWAAFALAGFSLLTAFIFHTRFSDPVQMIHFMKDLAIAGGLLLFVKYGAGQPSVDESSVKSRTNPGRI